MCIDICIYICIYIYIYIYICICIHIHACIHTKTDTENLSPSVAGDLIVDSSFRTNDPAVYAAGVNPVYICIYIYIYKYINIYIIYESKILPEPHTGKEKPIPALPQGATNPAASRSDTGLEGCTCCIFV